MYGQDPEKYQDKQAHESALDIVSAEQAVIDHIFNNPDQLIQNGDMTGADFLDLSVLVVSKGSNEAVKQKITNYYKEKGFTEWVSFREAVSKMSQ